MRQLAKILMVDRTSLTRSLGPLERDGLVQSLPSLDGPGTQTRANEPWRSAPEGSNSTLGARPETVRKSSGTERDPRVNREPARGGRSSGRGLKLILP
jgi:hypothetical protein